MKHFNLVRQLLSLVLIGLALFALFRYNLSPKLSAMALCKSKDACIKGLTLSDDGAHFLRYSEDGKTLFGIGVDGGRAWSVDKAYSAKRLGTFKPTSLAVAGDGRYAVAKSNAELILFSKEGKELLEFSTETAVKQLIFAPEGNLLLTVKGEALNFWHSQTGQFVTTLPHESSIVSLASSSLGLVAAGLANGKIILWPLEDLSKYQTLNASQERMRELSFSRDGQTLASADSSGTIKLWDMATLELKTQFNAGDSLITGLSLSQNGSRLAVSQFSGLLSFWDTATAKALGTWQYPREILSSALSPDGNHLAIALNDKAEMVTRDKSRANLSQAEKNFQNTLSDTYVKVSPAVILIRDLSQLAQ